MALDVSAWPRRFVLLYLALDPLQVFYGMAGMETQVAVAILLWSAWLATQDRPGQLGLSLGLALLVRPDFVTVGRNCPRLPRHSVPASGAPGRARRRSRDRSWLVFTTAYYGSPIPQTIIAKALVYAPAVTGSLWDWRSTRPSGMSRRWPGPTRRSSRTPSHPSAHPVGLAAAISAATWLLSSAGRSVFGGCAEPRASSCLRTPVPSACTAELLLRLVHAAGGGDSGSSSRQQA